MRPLADFSLFAVTAFRFVLLLLVGDIRPEKTSASYLLQSEHLWKIKKMRMDIVGVDNDGVIVQVWRLQEYLLLQF